MGAHQAFETPPKRAKHHVENVEMRAKDAEELGGTSDHTGPRNDRRVSSEFRCGSCSGGDRGRG
eukprot:9478194-Pyramimonas_sp.AAC.1